MKHRCITIVEDDSLVARSTKRNVDSILRELGATVEILMAANGKEAISIARELDRDHGHDLDVLLITDGNMPHMNGPEVIENLDVILGNRLRVRLLVSSDDCFKRDAEHLGASFLQKPYSRAELKKALMAFF